MSQSPVVRAPERGSDVAIELLRGIAALLVVLAHYQALAGLESLPLVRFAFTGVDLFFVISGFVFAPYLSGRRLAVVPHLVRRFFRLYPLYAVALLCYAALNAHTGKPFDHLLEHAFFLQTLHSRDVAFQFNPAFWSLPPEVEFYLLLPLLAVAAAGGRRVLALAALALIVHLAVAWFSPSDPAATNTAWVLSFHLPGLLVEFMLGALAWRIASGRPTASARAWMLGGGVVAWLLLAMLFDGLREDALYRSDVLRGNLGVLAALAYAAIVAAVAGWVQAPARWQQRTFLALGNLSYGVYLFHNAAPTLLSGVRPLVSGVAYAALCLATTLVVAQALHIAWEAPCRRIGRRWAERLRAASRSATA